MSALRQVIDALPESRRETPALSDDLVALDWEELDRRLGSAVAALRELDTQPAGRVAVMAHNSVETVLAHAAVMLAGLSPVPISFHLTADEVAYLLDVSQARVVLVGPETAQVAQRAAAAASRSVRVLGWRLDDAHPEAVGSVESWERLVAASGSDEDSSSVRPRPPLMFTSGTTGRPKPVEQPPNTFPAVDTVAELLSRFRDNPLTRFSPHLVVGPLYHTGPLTAVRLLLAGTSVVVHAAVRRRGGAAVGAGAPHRRERHGADALLTSARAAVGGAERLRPQRPCSGSCTPGPRVRSRSNAA